MLGEHELISLGLNHNTAPVELRERLAIPSERVPEHFQAIRERGLGHESIILSTCNRVEVYAVVDREDMGQGLTDYLAQSHGVNPRDLAPHLYQHRGRDAVSHLFRVASSLDSLVVGEPQILGQVKSAFQLASGNQAVGRVLQPVMRRTLSVAKRVRSETHIGQSAVSVGTAGVELAQQVFGGLQEHRALLIGAGEMGRLVTTALLSQGVEEVVVANRTYQRAVELANEFGASAVHMDQVERYLERVDICVVSTSARHHLLTRNVMQPIMRARRFRPLLLVDLSVPRNVAPDVHQLEGAYLFNVDDLAEVANRGKQRRAEAASVAERLVKDEAERCYRSLGALSAEPVIAGILAKAEQARMAELTRSAKVLEGMSKKDRKKIEAMTRSMFKRLLHDTMLEARAMGEAGDQAGLRLLARSFNIETDEEEQE